MGLMVWSPLAGGLLSGKYGPGAPDPENSRPRQLRLPAGEQGPRLGLRRRHARGGRGAWIDRRPRRPGLAPGQAGGDQRDRRRQAQLTSSRTTSALSNLKLTPEDIAKLDEVSKAARGISGLDDRPAGRRAPSQAVRAQELSSPARRAGRRAGRGCLAAAAGALLIGLIAIAFGGLMAAAFEPHDPLRGRFVDIGGAADADRLRGAARERPDRGAGIRRLRLLGRLGRRPGPG